MYFVKYAMLTPRGLEASMMLVKADSEAEAKRLCEEQVAQREYVSYCKAQSAEKYN